MNNDLALWLTSLVLIIPALLYAYIAVRDANKSKHTEKKS